MEVNQLLRWQESMCKQLTSNWKQLKATEKHQKKKKIGGSELCKMALKAWFCF